MKQVSLRQICWIFLCAALLLAVQTLYYRMQFEAENLQVEIAAEYGDLKKIATLDEIEPLQVLEQARINGLTCLVLLDEQALDPDPLLIEYLEITGLSVALQLSNREEYLEGDIVEVIAKALGVPNLRLLFFAGYEALGWPDQVERLADLLSYLRLPVGFVEMLGEQKGLESIVAKLDYSMVRIHPGYPYENLEDMARAVRERGIRFSFLKPFKNMGLLDPAELQDVETTALRLLPDRLLLASDASPKAMLHAASEAESLEATQVLIAWIRDLRSSLAASGFSFGGVISPRSLSLHPFHVFWLSLGILAAGILLISYTVSAPRLRGLLCAILLVAILLGALYGRGGHAAYLLYRDAIALLAAICFPTLGLIDVWGRFRSERNNPVPLPLWRLGLQTLLRSSAITLCGALIVNAMLTDSIYLSGWHPFRGVKIALILPPLLIIGQALWFELRGRGSLLKKAFTPLRFLLGALMIFASATYLLRSGNETASISGIEGMLRLNLESLFGARPRFKEFALGHPAGFLLGLAARLPWEEIALLLLFFAAIAQASLFNTFMHLHSPVLLGLRRSLWGLALGEILGALTLLVVAPLLTSFVPNAAAE